MKQTLLTISLLLSLTSAAAENEQQAPQSPAPAENAQASAPQAEERIPCPLPGEPATNCPETKRDVTEAGTGATAGGNVHNVLDWNKLLLGTSDIFRPDDGNQPASSPLRPVKDEK